MKIKMFKEQEPEKTKIRTELIGRWTGPIDRKNYNEGSVPPEEWPYGPPDLHQKACALFGGHIYCDCEASDESAT
ncbi:MAG: hypothetical protein UW08_C0010G0007 [Parcubacteria group bacterium GW2011_GWB1_43_8b]|nr:MAG: hypothetical protein UW08_C0010G0007 [Parcubacteria group bacterium GW2011_GWB1_43_8b]